VSATGNGLALPPKGGAPIGEERAEPLPVTLTVALAFTHSVVLGRSWEADATAKATLEA
jgi:hypothetical protein